MYCSEALTNPHRGVFSNTKVDLLIATVAQSKCEGYRWTRHAVMRPTGPRAVF